MKEARTKDPMMQPCRRGCGELVHLENDGFHVCRTSKQRLKNCPFCGDLPRGYHWPDHYGCSNEQCGAYMANLTAEQWNRRPAHDTQPVASNEWGGVEKLAQQRNDALAEVEWLTRKRDEAPPCVPLKKCGHPQDCRNCDVTCTWQRNMTHKDLVALIGEIRGISLESEPTSEHETLEDVVVYLELSNGNRFELIRALRTGEGIISHFVTREGIRQVLEDGPT